LWVSTAIVILFLPYEISFISRHKLALWKPINVNVQYFKPFVHNTHSIYYQNSPRLWMIDYSMCLDILHGAWSNMLCYL
jgi:hypothetical protein